MMGKQMVKGYESILIFRYFGMFRHFDGHIFGIPEVSSHWSQIRVHLEHLPFAREPPILL